MYGVLSRIERAEINPFYGVTSRTLGQRDARRFQVFEPWPALILLQETTLISFYLRPFILIPWYLTLNAGKAGSIESSHKVSSRRRPPKKSFPIENSAYIGLGGP